MPTSLSTQQIPMVIPSVVADSVSQAEISTETVALILKFISHEVHHMVKSVYVPDPLSVFDKNSNVNLSILNKWLYVFIKFYSSKLISMGVLLGIHTVCHQV